MIFTVRVDTHKEFREKPIQLWDRAYGYSLSISDAIELRSKLEAAIKKAENLNKITTGGADGR